MVHFLTIEKDLYGFTAYAIRKWRGEPGSNGSTSSPPPRAYESRAAAAESGQVEPDTLQAGLP
jgi:hypothetical protein